MKYLPIWVLTAAGVVAAYVFGVTIYATEALDANAAAWETLVAQLRVDEGFRSHTYKDTRGVETIGYGTDISQGITKVEADWLLRHRLSGMRDCLIRGHKPFEDYSAQVRNVLLNMVYEIGCYGTLEFHDMLAALDRGDIVAAAAAGRASEWYRAEDTHQRAERLVRQLENSKASSD